MKILPTENKVPTPIARRFRCLALAACLGGIAAAMPKSAFAHPLIPLSPINDANTTSVVITCIAIICGLEYFGLNKFATVRVRAGKEINEVRTQGGIIMLMIATALVIWHVQGPPSYGGAALAATSAHVDLPAHGGQILSAGENHLEAVVRPDLSLAVYVSGIIPNIAFPIKQEALFGTAIRQKDGKPDTAGATKILLHAQPQPKEPAGQSSVFVGQIPADLDNGAAPVALTLTLPISGQDHSLTFTIKPGSTAAAGPVLAAVPVHDTAATMVVSTPATPEQKALFLKPGGAYTAADIVANGSMTPEQRFGGQMANHHLNPKKGAVICPITMTQANSKFSWVVGGKKYLFCCPPCIAEFVKNAKSDPKSIKAPNKYVQM